MLVKIVRTVMQSPPQAFPAWRSDFPWTRTSGERRGKAMNGEISAPEVASSQEKKRTRRKDGNGFSENESSELAVILQTLLSVRNGDFSVRLPVVWTGLTGRIADTFNEIVSANQHMALELKR